MNNILRGINKTQIIFITIYSMLILIMPYYRGLFFEENLYFFELGLGIFVIATMFMYYRTKTVDLFSSVTIYPLTLFTAIYYFSSLQGYTPQAAFDDFLRQLTYLLVFIGLVIILNKKTSQWVLHALFVSVIWVGAFGLFAHFGWVDFKDAVYGGRISSVLQYPNTLAAVVGATIIGILLYVLRKDVKWYIRALYLTQLVPLFISFFYTESRAAYLVFLIVWFVAMFFLNIRQQIMYILISLLLFLFSLPNLLKYEQYLAEQDGKIIYFIFALGIVYSVISIGLLLFVERKENSNNSRSNYFRLLIPGLMIILAIISLVLILNTSIIEIFPDRIKNSLTNLNDSDTSLNGRSTFFSDSISLFKDHWFIGAGGKAWNNMYYTYQSYPYLSTQTHSYFMKTLTDVGLVGTLLFFVFIFMLIFMIYRWVRKHGLKNEGLLKIGIPFSMALMIFTHSQFDFNMSYGYVSIFWFSLLALVYIEVREEQTEYRFKNKAFSKIGIYAVTIPAIIFMIYIAKYAIAASINLSDMDYAKALDRSNTKVSLSPSNVEYRLQRMDLLEVAYRNTGDESFKNTIMEDALFLTNKSRHNPVTLIRLGQVFAKYGYGVNAHEVTSVALEKAPWLQAAYDQYITISSQLSVLYLQKGNVTEASQELQKLNKWLDQLDKNIEYVKDLPPHLQYPGLKLSEPIRANGGIALVLLSEYERANIYLEPMLNSSNLESKLNATLWISINEETHGNTDRAEQLSQAGRELDTNFDQRRIELAQLVKEVAQ